MINAKSTSMLLFMVGLVMVFSLEPLLVLSSSNSESMFKSTNEVGDEMLSKVDKVMAETKNVLAKGVEVVAKPIEKSMGWFRRKPKVEDQLEIAKENFNLAKEEIHEAKIELKEAVLENLNLATQSVVEKANAINCEACDKTSQAISAIKNVATNNKHKMELEIEQKVENIANYAVEIGRAREYIYDESEQIKKKLQNTAEGAIDEVYNNGVKTKDMASIIVKNSKDKINEGVEHTQDVVIGGLQSGLDKTKSAITDKAKGLIEHITHNTKEKEKDPGVLARVKDEAYKNVDALQSQTQEVGSHLHNLGQAVGHEDKERQLSSSLSEEIVNVGENVKKIGDGVTIGARDVQNNGKSFGRQSYNNLKKKANHFYKDHIGENYDTTQNTYDKVGQHYESSKDYYDGSTNHHKKTSDRRSHKSARDFPFQSYYDETKDEANDYYNNMKDKTTHAFDDAYSRTKDSFDNAKDQIDRYIFDEHKEGSGKYISTAKQKIANGYNNVRDQAKDYYHNEKFKPKKDLSAMAESMGWRRIGIVNSNVGHVPLDDEVVIGNVKYEWHNKDEHPNHESISDNVLNSLKDVTHKIGKNIDLANEHISRDVQNMQEIGTHAKDQVQDAFQSSQHEKLQHQWIDPRSRDYKNEDDNNYKDDDYISNRRTRNQNKGRSRNGGHLHEFQGFRKNENANLIKHQSSFVQYGDNKTLKRNSVFHLWKSILSKKPKGIPLLLTRALHLLTFSIVYGSSFWVTFVSSFILSKHIPRQQFGYVQSRIFPVYLRILIAGQCILFILHSILHPWFIANSFEQWELSNFGLMIVSAVINTYVLEPQATMVMFERLKVEKEEGRGLETVTSPMDAKLLMEEHKKKIAILNQQFKTLHNYSSALNLISLGGLTCHLWHLANCLVI